MKEIQQIISWNANEEFSIEAQSKIIYKEDGLYKELITPLLVGTEEEIQTQAQALL